MSYGNISKENTTFYYVTKHGKRKKDKKTDNCFLLITKTLKTHSDT